MEKYNGESWVHWQRIMTIMEIYDYYGAVFREYQRGDYGRNGGE